MTTRGRSLRVNIAGDADQLKRELASMQRGIKDAERELTRMGLGGAATANREATSLARTLGGLRSNYVALGAAAVGATAAIGGGVAIVRNLADAASALQESQSKANVVFGESVAAVNRFSETSATSFGISQQAALAAAGAYGNMFSTIGLTQSASAEMSVTMVQLAADMASFNDEDPSAMLDRLRSGLSGEAEPLRQFGVLLNEAAVKEEAYASGIAKRGAELTEAEKVQARFNLIMRQTEIQQGDVARTSGSLANQQRELAAQVDNLQAKIGTELLPYVEDITQAMNEWIETEGDDFAERLAAGIGGAVETAGDLKQLLADIKGFGPIRVAIDVAMDDKSSATLITLATLAGLKYGGLAAGGTAGPTAVGLLALNAPVTNLRDSLMPGRTDNPGFADWVLGGALAPFRAAGAAIGGLGDAFGQATDFRPSEATLRLYATNPELFNDFQAAEIEQYMPGRQAAADALMGMLSPDRENILRQRARWGGLGSEDDLYGFTGYDAPNPRTSGDEEKKGGGGGGRSGPTAFSAEDLAFIERTVGGLNRAGWLPSSLQEFEAMQGIFDARREDLKRTLAELGLEMADLDARGQEQTETYTTLKGRVEAAQDALKRIDLVEDLRLEPFRDAMKEAREAVDALARSEKARHDALISRVEGRLPGIPDEVQAVFDFTELVNRFTGRFDDSPDLELFLPLLQAATTTPEVTADGIAAAEVLRLAGGGITAEGLAEALRGLAASSGGATVRVELSDDLQLAGT